MKIGIDVDGVLSNIEKYQIEAGKKYFKMTDDQIDTTKFEIEDIFHCSHEEASKFWTKYIWSYCINYKPYDNAADVISLLKSKGNSIHIITRRVHTTEDSTLGKIFRKMLLKWLEKNNISYDSITFCTENGTSNDKLSVCKRNKIDIMIEDDPDNIINLQNDMKVICINHSYNTDQEFNDNVFRVDSFSDVYSVVQKICNDREIQMKFFKDPYIKTQKRIMAVGVPLFKTMLHPTINDADRIPEEGPVILCGNHLHVWDQFPAICGTDRVSHWMSKKEYFDGKLGKFFKKSGAICVDRFGDASSSKLEALNYLEVGSMVGLFPEGTRNHPKKEKIDSLYSQYMSEDVSKEEFMKSMSSVDSLLSRINILEEMYKEGRISSEQFKTYLMDIKSGFATMLESGIISSEEHDDSLLLPFKYGAVSMAKHSGAKIVPFGVNGSYTVSNDDLTVSFGEPIEVTGISLDEANLRLRKSIISLEKKNMK